MAKVSVGELWRSCELDVFSCMTSEEMSPLEVIVGQERAVRALQFGLAVKEQGFNIYVAGVPGTGRTTAVKRFLESVARDKPVPNDLCYVNNFRDSYRPKALSLPPGQARKLQVQMRGFVEGAQREIRRAFESEEYAARREETLRAFQRKRDELFLQLSEKARQAGFVIQASPVGLLTVPLKDGQPLADEEFQALTAEEKEKITRRRDEVQAEVTAAIRQAQSLEKGASEGVKALDRDVALYALGPLIDDIKEGYQGLPDVVAYLDTVRDDILENLAQFRGGTEGESAPSPMPGAEKLPLRKYEVNVLVDNSDLKGAPVVIELNPTYNNLFGRIDKEPQFGMLFTDFTMIREGALYRANGGYLVLHATELLSSPFAWDSLKRSLRNRQVAVEEAGERLGYMATKTLRPEDTPIDVKVVLIGDSRVYNLLYALDEDFAELFKVKADFDIQMDRTGANMESYAAFMCTVCREEGLKHLDRSAIAQVVEHGSRLAEDQEKLSTRFGELADVIREASFYAAQDAAPYVTADHVRKAIEERYYRSNLIQERIREMIERGVILIDVKGARVGQVNGLSVIGLGDIAFGQPSRITVSIGLGRAGVVDIEREAKLGGPLHTKGVMILSGYLVDRYAQDKPLSLSAQVVFEQSYSGVDGDSASSTELYAILSSLSGLPIQQGIAVTGSVNQKGIVQAIGGVNEKIEGFFEVCRAKGFTGEQGVMIPASNVKNLMLKEKVVQAVRDGTFHIWSVETIDEGIEILTGVRAGSRKADGSFEDGTVSALVDQRLRNLAESMCKFAGATGSGGKAEE